MHCCHCFVEPVLDAVEGRLQILQLLFIFLLVTEVTVIIYVYVLWIILCAAGYQRNIEKSYIILLRVSVRYFIIGLRCLSSWSSHGGIRESQMRKILRTKGINAMSKACLYLCFFAYSTVALNITSNQWVCFFLLTTDFLWKKYFQYGPYFLNPKV